MWKRDDILKWLAAFFIMVGLIWLTSNCGNFGLADEEVSTYRVRESFIPLLKGKRYVDVSAMPSEFQVNLGASIGQLNAALKHHHGIADRFNVLDGELPLGGVLAKVIPWTKGECSPDSVTQTIEFLDPNPTDHHTIHVCVNKIRVMMQLRGELLLRTPMAERLQSLDHPWVYILSHSILHTDLPDHIVRGGTEGLMYFDQPGDEPLRLRNLQISDHEMKVWGAAVLPLLGAPQ